MGELSRQSRWRICSKAKCAAIEVTSERVRVCLIICVEVVLFEVMLRVSRIECIVGRVEEFQASGWPGGVPPKIQGVTANQLAMESRRGRKRSAKVVARAKKRFVRLVLTNAKARCGRQRKAVDLVADVLCWLDLDCFWTKWP